MKNSDFLEKKPKLLNFKKIGSGNLSQHYFSKLI